MTLGTRFSLAFTHLKGLVQDHALLAVLEVQRAGISLVKMIAAAIVISILVVSAWMAIVAAAVVWAVGAGAHGSLGEAGEERRRAFLRSLQQGRRIVRAPVFFGRCPRGTRRGTQIRRHIANSLSYDRICAPARPLSTAAANGSGRAIRSHRRAVSSTTSGARSRGLPGADDGA